MKAVITVHKCNPIQRIVNHILGIETKIDDTRAYEDTLLSMREDNSHIVYDDEDDDILNVAIMLLAGKIC